MSMEKLLFSVIEALFQSAAVSSVLYKQVKLRNKEKLKFSLLMWLYCLLCFFFIKNQFRFVLCIVTISLIMYFVLKIRDKRIVLYAFSSVMILSLAEILVTIILVKSGVNSDMLVNNVYYNLLMNILISLLTIAISFIPVVKILLNKFIAIATKKEKLIRYIYVLLIVLYLITLKNGLNAELVSNYYVNMFITISLIFLLFIIIKNELKSEQLKETNQQMLNFVTKYEKIITEQGKANHEFKNQLMVIRGYAQMKSDKLIEYIDSIVEDSKKAHSSYLISQLNKFPDGGIKGLLYYKLSIMEDEKIKYEINVDDGVKRKLNSLDTVNYKNITKVLGVLLDNAIDASKQSKNKKIIISVIKDKTKVIFEIYNTYKGTLDITKIGTGYTSKGNGRGYGLRLVKDIIDNDTTLDIHNSLEDIYYISSLEIKIKTKRKIKK